MKLKNMLWMPLVLSMFGMIGILGCDLGLVGEGKISDGLIDRSASPGGTGFSDDFEDGSLDGWTTSGGSWSVVEDSGSSVLRQNILSGNAYAVLDNGEDFFDYKAEIKIKALEIGSSSGQVILSLYYKNDGNRYFVVLDYYNNLLELRERVDGSTAETLESVSYAFSVGTEYSVKIGLDATGKKVVKINDETKILTTDFDLAAGTICLSTYNARATFDDISVISLNSQLDELQSASFNVNIPLTGIGADSNAGRRDPSSIIKVGNTYYVYYSRANHNMPRIGYDADIYYATSTDTVNWTEQGVAISRGSGSDHDAGAVFTPEVIIADDKYYLYYSCVKDWIYEELGETYLSSSANNRLNTYEVHINVASSDSPDGPWMKNQDNPILSPSGVAGDFDGFRTDDANVIKINGQYHLYYKGRSLEGGASETQQGVAISDSPHGEFIKYANNPLFDAGHEVFVWRHREGITAMVNGVSDTGSDADQFHYSLDGLHWISQSTIPSPNPVAAAAYSPDNYLDDGYGSGITWGVDIGSTGSMTYIDKWTVSGLTAP